MALAPNSCNITFNWNSDQDDATTTLSSIDVIKHTYLDIDSSDDYQNGCYDDRIKSENSHLLKFVRAPEHEHFVCMIVCSDPSCAQINGISIESESRTLELSSNLGGYIKTVRGKSTNYNEPRPTSDGSMFVCSTTFDNPCSDLSIKFLSLGDKEKISIRSISINMQRHNLHFKKPGIGSNFDLTRLKKDVEAMGDTVPAGAFGLLDAMETFEKNKINSLGSLLASGSLNPTFSNQSVGNTSTQKEAFPSNMAAIMQSVLGDSALKNLEKNISGTGLGPSEDNGQIFNMLQAVCGKVTEARTAKTQGDEKLEQTEQGKKVTNGINQMEGNKLLLTLLDQRLEEAKQDMRGEIQKVKQEVIQQIENVKQEINGQLSQILNCLQSLQLNFENPS